MFNPRLTETLTDFPFARLNQLLAPIAPPANLAMINMAVGVFCAAATWVIIKIVDAMVGLRVTRDEEIEGLDTALHGERVQ